MMGRLSRLGVIRGRYGMGDGVFNGEARGESKVELRVGLA